MTEEIVVLSKDNYDRLVAKENYIKIKCEKLPHLSIKEFRIALFLSNPKLIITGELHTKIKESFNVIIEHIKNTVERESRILNDKEHSLNCLKSELEKERLNLSKAIDFVKQNERDVMCRKIANMSYWERRKFLKEWKQK